MGAEKNLVVYTILVSVVGGLLFGYAIGFVPIYTTFINMNAQCTKFTSEEACSTLPNSKCVWAGALASNGTANFTCSFGDYKTVDCSAIKTKEECAKVDVCEYDYQGDKCDHTLAWSVVEEGVFAGAMIVGGTIGAMFGGKINDALGRKKTILFIGVLGIIASALCTIAAAADNYGALIVARLIIGVASGTATVACPSYVVEMAPEAHAAQIGLALQIAITFGIVLAAFMGLVLEPRDFTVDSKLMLRFQVFIGVQWLVSLVCIPVGILMPESTKWLRNRENASTEGTGLMVDDNNGNSKPEGKVPVKTMILPLTVAAVAAISLQLTGINAIMNYAPNITKSAGLSPLVGNFVVMLWNFLTTLISIPLSKRFSYRILFLGGLTVASVACFVTGLPIFPEFGVAASARHVLAGTGIMVFIAAFEVGMGSTFYIISQRLFPSGFRSVGTSWTMMVNFFCNIIVNVGFPICVQAASGGPSGNQDKGMGVMFVVFGSIGIAAAIVGFKYLHPYVEESAEGTAEEA